MAKEDVLIPKENGKPVLQEIVILDNGVVEIPWVTPRASGLVRALAALSGDDNLLASGPNSTNIYCG